jgi:hypothetical protein
VLSGQLRRLAPNLRELGYTIEFDRTAGRKTILIHRDNTVTTVTTDTGAPLNDANDADDADDDRYPTANEVSDINEIELPF